MQGLVRSPHQGILTWLTMTLFKFDLEICTPPVANASFSGRVHIPLHPPLNSSLNLDPWCHPSTLLSFKILRLAFFHMPLLSFPPKSSFPAKKMQWPWGTVGMDWCIKLSGITLLVREAEGQKCVYTYLLNGQILMLIILQFRYSFTLIEMLFSHIFPEELAKHGFLFDLSMF